MEAWGLQNHTTPRSDFEATLKDGRAYDALPHAPKEKRRSNDTGSAELAAPQEASSERGIGVLARAESVKELLLGVSAKPFRCFALARIRLLATLLQVKLENEHLIVRL